MVPVWKQINPIFSVSRVSKKHIAHNWQYIFVCQSEATRVNNISIPEVLLMGKIMSVLLSIAIIISIVMVTIFSQDKKMGVDDFYPSIISAGDSVSMAIKSDNSLWAWGTNAYGQLTNKSDFYSLEPIRIMDDVISVDTGRNFSIALKSDGSLWAWGRLKQFGLEGERQVPVKIMDGVRAAMTGSDDIAYIKADGSLWLWGETINTIYFYLSLYEQIGEDYISTLDEHDLRNYTEHKRKYDGISEWEPIKIMDDIAFASVSESIYSGRVLAIKTDGTLWQWTSQSTINIFELSDVAYVSFSGDLAMVVKNDGSLWAWGKNYSVYVGNGSTEEVLTPVQIMEDVAYVSIGAWHTLAVKTDGSLWAWGENEYGQLGNGKITTHEENNDSLIPIKIMDDVVYISAGEHHSLAVKSDGSLWEWGDIFRDETFSRPMKVMDGIKMPVNLRHGRLNK